jgi:hypothetical protein
MRVIPRTFGFRVPGSGYPRLIAKPQAPGTWHPVPKPRSHVSQDVRSLLRITATVLVASLTGAALIRQPVVTALRSDGNAPRADAASLRKHVLFLTTTAAPRIRRISTSPPRTSRMRFAPRERV